MVFLYLFQLEELKRFHPQNIENCDRGIGLYDSKEEAFNIN